MRNQTSFIITSLILGINTLLATGVYIGTYTTPEKGSGEGIYYFHIDDRNDEISLPPEIAAQATIDQTVNSSYLLINQDTLYAVNELSPIGSVTAYSINSNHTLTFINTESTGLASPVCLLMDNSKKNLIIANYGDNTPNSTSGLTVLPIQEKNKVGASIQKVPYLSTPTISHTHGVAKQIIEGVEYIFATDLGTGMLYAYKFDPTEKEPLQLFASASCASGQGPRHAVVSKNGKYIYVANEVDAAQPTTSSVSIFRFDAKSKSLILLKSVKAEHQSDLTINYPSELAIHGPHLFLANRGGNNIAKFDITNGGEDLTYVTQVSNINYQWPREFAITPNGKYLVAAYQKSNNVMVFRIEDNGHLKEVKTSQPININSPVSIAFTTN